MGDLLSVLANYGKIHGILILLKPNNARLTRFCIKELLTHLHRDATRNMVFGFTNTRGSNYKPGDTFEPLKNELACNPDVEIGLYEHTVYCFDSESFRYLAAHHQGVDLGDQADYSQSWEKSAKESHRLMTYFQNLKPHLVKSTVSLNETRNIITGLTKPMAEIMRTMNETIKSLSEDDVKKQDLERIAAKEELIKAIKAEHEEIEHAAIGFCLFLKKNSIKPYKDATLDYLAHMIKEERGKVAVGGDPGKLEGLEKYRDQYQEQVKILTEKMDQGTGFELMTEQQVRNKVNHLYLLRYYGDQLRQIKTVVKKTHGDTFREESHSGVVRSTHWNDRDR